MEQIMLWVTIVGIIVIPLMGWLFNTLITRKIDAQDARNDEQDEKNDKNFKELQNLFFKRLDEDRAQNEANLKELIKDVKDNYVQSNIYKQAMDFYHQNTDEKFKSLLSVMNTQFDNVESKIDGTNQQIGELKKIINDKFNNNGSK